MTAWLRAIPWMICLIGLTGCPESSTPGDPSTDGTLDASLDGQGKEDASLEDTNSLDIASSDIWASLDALGADIAAGEFGAPCSNNDECYSGWCVEGPQGYLCTKMCKIGRAHV